MTKIKTLPDGDVLVQQEYFDGEEMAVMERKFTVKGAYVYQVHSNGSTSKVCDGLLPTGPTLRAGDDLADTIRKTLGLRGGHRPGSGRPPAPPTIMIRVRLTPEQHKSYTERGAEHWLKRVLSEPRNKG